MLIIYNLFLLISVLFFSGLVVFFNYKYLLINLLSLEYIMLSMLFYTYVYVLLFNYELFFMMVFLTYSVCEGVMGLSLLISMVRSFGNNYYRVVSGFMC